MTVQTTTLRADYTGNGSTTAFTIPFYFLDNTHVKVIRTQISTGVATTLALTTDYTLTGVGVSTGGTVTMVTAPTTDQKISVLRNMPFTQLTHYVPNDPFPAATHEAVVDQLKMDVQQLNEAANRAISLSQNSSGVSATLPTPTASYLLGWNSGGTGLQNYSTSDLATSITYSVARTDLFSGTGAQTAFTLSNDPGSVNNCDVAIAGVTQRPGVDFTVSGKVLTFTAAPASGTNNVCVRYANALTAIPAGSYSGSSRTVPVNVTYGASVTVDASLSNVFYIGTLTGNTALTITNPSDGQTINIRFVQDSTGGRTVTLPGSVSVNGSLITTASYVDWLVITYVAASSRWEGAWANATITPTATGTALITAADATAARTAITAAASGANTDITSLNAPALGGATATTQAASNNSTKVATTAYVDTAVAAVLPTLVPVRQTVLSGPVDSNGLPSFGGSTGSTTVTATGTLIATAANGAGSTGGVDRVGSITNPSWTGLSTAGTMYLYLDIASNGTCTTGSTTLAPVYQWGGTYSTTNGQFTFNIQAMSGQVGNGSTAAQTYRVFVGEVAVSVAPAVTSITWYALMGRYASPEQACPAANTIVSMSHNIGCMPTWGDTRVRWKSAVNGHAIGDESSVMSSGVTNGNIQLAQPSYMTKMVIAFNSGSNFSAQNISGGAGVGDYVVLTSDATQKLVFYANRGW